MYSLYSITVPCSSKISKFSTIFPTLRPSSHQATFGRRTRVRAEARSDGLDTSTVQEGSEQQEAESSSNSKPKPPPLPSAAPDIDKNLKKVSFSANRFVIPLCFRNVLQNFSISMCFVCFP